MFIFFYYNAEIAGGQDLGNMQVFRLVYIGKGRRGVSAIEKVDLYNAVRVAFDNVTAMFPGREAEELVFEASGKEYRASPLVTVKRLNDTVRPTSLKNGPDCGGIQKGLIAGEEKVIFRRGTLAFEALV
jgi:hypothetical protein